MFIARQKCGEHPKPNAVWVSLILCALAASGLLTGSAAEAQEADRRQQRPFVLENAVAEEVAPQVREALSRMPGKPEVFVDVNRNRVIVHGNRNALETAADLIQTLDVVSEVEQEPAQKPIARGYKVDPALLDSTLKSLRELYKSQPAVSINADKRTSKIVVFGPPDVQLEVAQAIAAPTGVAPQIEKPRNAGPRALAISTAPRRQAQAPLNASVQQRQEAIHRFRNLSWEDFEDALRQIWGNQIEVIPDEDGEGAEVRLATRDGETHFLHIDRRRNQIAAANPEPITDWRRIARVLDGLDIKADEEAQLMKVASARPAHVSEVVHALLTSAKQAKQPIAGKILRRDPKTAKWGGDLVSRVFQQDPPAQDRPAAERPAQEKPADEKAEQDPDDPTMQDQDPLAEFFAGDDPISPDVRIEYVEALDIILITGPAKDVAKVKRLIEILDETTKSSQPGVEIVTLRHTNNEVLSPLLTQINDQVLVNRQGRVTIIPLGKPNAILLIGQEESVQVLRSYIDKLDVPSKPEDEFQVFKLRHVPAADAETAIRNFFSNNPTSGGQQNQNQGGANAAANNRPGLGTRVRIISEYRTNSLIVQGGPDDLRAVEALLKEIDVENSPSVAIIKVFQLKTSSAADLAPILQAAISGQSSLGGLQGAQGNQGGGGQNNQGTSNAPSASLQFIQVREDGTKTIDSGIPTNVVIEADTGTNSLVVRGPARTMDLIEHLVKQLDGVAKVGASIRVFQMQNADAQQVLTNLQQLFGVTNQAAGGVQQQGAALTAPTSEGESPLVRLRMAIDARSNSLIVAGNQGDLNVIEALLSNIDTVRDNSRRLYVYRLVNNDAQFVATAVQTLITNQQTQIRNQAQTTFLRGRQELLDSEIFIQPELVTNSVIISATKEKLADVIRVIQHLDLRQPMVMVQMLIAEVTLENINEFGMELGLQDSILFDRGLNGLNAAPVPGFPFVGQPLGNSPGGANNVVDRQIVAGQGYSQFGLGRSSTARGYGGLVLSASSESVSLLIRALQERNRLQILSRPEVMTVDRIPAQVLVGQNVPLVGATNVTVNTTTANVDRTNVGISLLVTPQVNADGQIMIEVDATRSALGALADGIPIPSGTGTVLQPIINVTQAVSTLSCRSGQTVIMAGLITKNDSVSRRGIPGLMEIPVVGKLFQFNSESTRRTELLMIMTPHIIWDGEDLNWLKQTESERMSWCLADVAEIDGDRGYARGYGKWGSMNTNRIFPHTQQYGVEECVPAPGPPAYFERRNMLRNGVCPPVEGDMPPESAFGPSPPSEIENRSNWGPMASPLHLLRHPDQLEEEGAEELVPPAPEPMPENFPADPNSPLRGPGQLPPTPGPDAPAAGSTSLRSAVQSKGAPTRNASTRRRAVQPPAETESESEQVIGPVENRSAARRPAAPVRNGAAPKENVPARYESRPAATPQREIEPAAFEEERAPRKTAAPSNSRRRQ